MIELIFFTSSSIKLAHARYLCREYDVKITGFREKTFGANYFEPRIFDREKLIEQSYQDALIRWNKSSLANHQKLFFLEDTSVAIEALSSEQETPGLDIKYWMAETNFSILNAQLETLGNNRSCTVRSDLVLHLTPDLKKITQDKSYLCFTSSSIGSVVNEEHYIDTNPMYPWLDNKTFNKWFVPKNCSKPISLLSIEEADRYDFRAPAFKKMLSFLEQHGKISKRSTSFTQPSLLAEVPLIIICGPSCAGKTTLAEYIVDHYNYYHIEASDFMYLSYYQRHGVGSSVNIGDFAELALREQPEIVAEQILKNLESNPSIPTVITGFRSPLELNWFQRYYQGYYPIRTVFVDANKELRFQRSTNRQREEVQDTWERFSARDEQQASMGLSELFNTLVNDRIENATTLDVFFKDFELRYLHEIQGNYTLVRYGKLKVGPLERLILTALASQRETRQFYTTTEIAHLINISLNTNEYRSKNNVSRYFNQRFYPYFEIKLIDGKRKYRLSNTGLARARLLTV